MKQRGFSLVELIVVLAVMAVLAGISVPVVVHQVGKAKKNATIREMAGLAKSLRAHAADVGFDPAKAKWGRFPAEVNRPGKYKPILGPQLETNETGSGWNAALAKGWNGPYVGLDQVQTDPDGKGNVTDIPSYQVDGWGRYYIYKNRVASGPGGERLVTLTSGGPDLNPKTDSDNITLIVYRGVSY